MATAALGLWEYTRGDARLVGVLVLLIVIAAIAYVAGRAWTRGRRR